MRIISGSHKGRGIHPPKNLPVRPTTDFAKESLFNILNNQVDFESVSVLDLFAGTGNITYEFLSRGCSNITSVDHSFACCSFIKKTIEDLKLPRAKVIKADVFSILKNDPSSYDLIFADPPYDLENIREIAETIMAGKVLKKEGLLIVEHGPRTILDQVNGFVEKRHYGNVNFSFFRHPSTSLEP